MRLCNLVCSAGIDARLLKDARNIGEAEAIQRHVTRGESVSWCDQGYSWAEQDAVSWFYLAVLLFLVLPYLTLKVKARGERRFNRAEACDKQAAGCGGRRPWLSCCNSRFQA